MNIRTTPHDCPRYHADDGNFCGECDRTAAFVQITATPFDGRPEGDYSKGGICFVVVGFPNLRAAYDWIVSVEDLCPNPVPDLREPVTSLQAPVSLVVRVAGMAPTEQEIAAVAGHADEVSA